MAFEVHVKASEKKDLFKAIKYYEEVYPDLAKKFYNEFLNLNELLAVNPYLAIKYKYIRTYKLKSFPYLVHFVIDEEKRMITIIAIVFGKRKKTDFEFRVAGI